MLPNASQSYIDKAKITDYLLALSHPDGRSKAMYFLRFGFTADHWQEFADALLSIARTNPVIAVVRSAHGVRYTVDGELLAPDGRRPKVRTVWVVEKGADRPRLVTAYPA